MIILEKLYYFSFTPSPQDVCCFLYLCPVFLGYKSEVVHMKKIPFAASQFTYYLS